MPTASHTRWVVLTRGQAYNLKEHGLSFENGVPKEVSPDIAEELKHTGSFLITDAHGHPIPTEPRESDSVAFVPPPPVFEASRVDESVIELADVPSKDTKNIIAPGDDLNDKDVLLRRHGGIGDVVFVAHVAAEIKQRWPRARVRLAVNNECVQFAEMFDAVDSAMDVDTSCTYDVVSRQDYVIPFHNVIEKNHEYKADFFDAHWQRAGLGDKAPDKLPMLRVNRFALNADVQRDATKFLRDNGIGELPYVAIVIGTAGPLKMYSSEYMKVVAETIARTSADNPGVHVVCIGNYKQILDRPFKPADEFKARIAFSMQSSLAVSAELIRRARAVVGVDTGLIQFAASIHVPTVSLWGPINPEFSIEHYDGPQKQLRGVVECSPCNTLRLARCAYYKADGAACMKSIKPESVAEAAASLLVKHATHDADVLDTSALVVNGERIPTHRADNTRVRVAVLLDNGHMHSGGGHYLWRSACVLSKDPELDVTVFTDATSNFVYEANGAPVKIRFGEIRYVNDRAQVSALDASFDVVIAGPPHMGSVVSDWKNGVRADGVTILAVYETPAMIARHRKGLDTKEEFWSSYKAALLACDYIWCISKPVREALHEWHENFSNKKLCTIDLVYPCVNTPTANAMIGNEDVFTPEIKDDTVVMIARRVGYKRLAETAAALLTGPLTARALRAGKAQKLTIIGDGVRGLKDLLPTIPGVELDLRENVSEHDKYYALRRAKVVVHPSDLEGFGIVIAEAMYCGTPVVVQALPEYEASFSSYPYTYATDEELATTVETIFDAYENDVVIDTLRDDVRNARDFVADRYTEGALSKRLRAIFSARKKLQAVKSRAAERAAEDRVVTATKNLRVAVVCSWGTQCGIAETTRQVLDQCTFTYKVFAALENETAKAFDDARSVRCWDRGFASTRALQDELLRFQPHVVHFHHEFSFYRNEQRLFALIDTLRTLGIKVIVTAHTYAPSAYFDKLADSVDKLVLTKPVEAAPANSACVPLPVLTQYARVNTVDARRALGLPLPHAGLFVGSLGMWVPHKGFGELLSTVNDVSLRCGADTRYLIAGYANPRTPYMSKVVDAHKALFDTHRVIRRCDFMSDKDLFMCANACDVLVYNYSVAGHFSASAALRSGMAAGRPIICTHSPMFSEFEDGTHVLKVPFGDLQELTNAICRLYADTDLRSRLVRNCDTYINDCTPQKVARQYSDLYLAVLQKQ